MPVAKKQSKKKTPVGDPQTTQLRMPDSGTTSIPLAAGSSGLTAGAGVSVGGTSAHSPSAKPVAAVNRVPHGWIRGSLRGLTTRGRSFVAAGLAAAVCAFLLGQRDLLRVGVLLIALPLITALVIGRAHYRLSLHRTITPPRTQAGTVAKVRLEMEHLSKGLTRVLLAEDQVPYGLGPSPRFVISRLPGGRRAAVTYSLRTSGRGRYEIGPLHLTLADPFGMAEVTRSFTATDPLMVLPQTWSLTGVPTGGQWSGSGESAHGSAAASGEQDVAVREYRYGDDFRRVHWKTSARRGELMVRRDIQPRERRATVLLDTRAAGHDGEGMGSSLEWGVSAAASVVNFLAEQRYAVRLLTDSHAATWNPSNGAVEAGRLLDKLATVQAGGNQVLPESITTLQQSHGDGLVVAILGAIDPRVTGVLNRARRTGTSGVAMLLRTWEWAGRPATSAQMTAIAQSASLLRSAGWHTIEVGPDDSIPAAWQRALASTGPGRRSGGSSSLAPPPTTLSGGIRFRAMNRVPSTNGTGGTP